MQSQLISSLVVKKVPLIMGEIRKEMRKAASPDFSVLQFRTLARLSAVSLTNKQLAEWIGVDKTTMSKAVRGMESKGLVKKEIRKEDKREAYIKLTEAGKERYGKISVQVMKDMDGKLSSLSGKDLKKIYEGREILSGAMNR